MGNKWTHGNGLSRTEKNMRDRSQKQADSVPRIPKPKSRIVDGARAFIENLMSSKCQ